MIFLHLAAYTAAALILALAWDLLKAVARKQRESENAVIFAQYMDAKYSANVTPQQIEEWRIGKWDRK